MQHQHPTTDSPASASSSTLVISDSPSHLGKLDDDIPPPPNVVNIDSHSLTPTLPIPIPITTPKERPSPPQLSLTTQTSTSPNLSRMSSRGFVEPHKNHLPRRSKPRASVSATATPELPQTAPLPQSQSLSHPHHPISGSISSVIAGVQAASALSIGGDTPRTNTLSPALAEAGSPPSHPVPATAPLPRRTANVEVGIGLGLALQSGAEEEVGDGPGYSSFSVLGAGQGGGNELQAELDLAMKKLKTNEDDEPTPETPQPPLSSKLPASDQSVFSTPQPQSAPVVNQFPTPSVLALSQHVHNWTPPPIGLDRRTPRAKGAVGPGWSSVPRRSGGVRNREGSPLRNESPLRDLTGRAQSPLRNESFVGERRAGVADRAKSQLRDRRMSVKNREEEGEGGMRGRERMEVKRNGKGARDESPLRRGRSVFARGRDEGSGVADVDVEMSGSNVEVLDGQPLRPESLLEVDVDGEVDAGVEDGIEGSCMMGEVANVEDAPCAFQELRVSCERGEVGVWLGLLPVSVDSAESDRLEIVLRLRELEEEGKVLEGEKQDDTPKDNDTPARLRTRSQSIKSSSKIRWTVKNEKRISVPPPAPSSYIPLSSPNEHEDVKPSISDSYPVGVPCLSATAVNEAVGVLNGWWASTLDNPSRVLVRSRRLEVLVPRERKEDGICVVLCFLLGVLSEWGVVEDLGSDDAEEVEQGHIAKNAEEEKEGRKRLAAMSSCVVPGKPVGGESDVGVSSQLDASCPATDRETSTPLSTPETTVGLLPPEAVPQPAHNLLFALVDGSGEVEISSAKPSMISVDEVANIAKDEGLIPSSGAEEGSQEHVDANDDHDVLVVPPPAVLTDFPPPSSIRTHRISMRGHGQAGGVHLTSLERELTVTQPLPPIPPVDSTTVALPAEPSQTRIAQEAQLDLIPITMQPTLQPNPQPAIPTPEPQIIRTSEPQIVRTSEPQIVRTSEPQIVRTSYIAPAAPVQAVVARTKRMDTPLNHEWMGVLSADGMDVVEEIWRGINEERAKTIRGLGSV